MKLLKTAVLTFLTLCFFSTSAMAAVVYYMDYAGDEKKNESITYEKLKGNSSGLDIVGLDSQDFSAGDELVVTMSYYLDSGDSWSLYAGGDEPYGLDPSEGTESTDGFVTQSFSIFIDADDVTNGLDLSLRYSGSGNGKKEKLKIDYIEISSISSVPTPASFLLFGSGLLGLIVFKRNRQR